MTRSEVILQRYGLAAILVAGAAVRLLGIGFGLPNTEARPGETFAVSLPLHMAKSGLNPRFFYYPSLLPYFLLIAYGAYFLIGYTVGAFGSLQDFSALYYVDPTPFYLIARLSVAVSGILTIFLVYLLGKRLYGGPAGRLAALFLAFCPIHVRESHFGRVDVPMTCLMVLAALFLLDICRRGTLKDYLMAGWVSGLATSTKYPAGILSVGILAAHLLRRDHPPRRLWRRLAHPHFCLAAVVMVASFFAASPFILIDWKGFLKDFGDLSLMLTGQYGGPRESVYGQGWVYHATFSLRHGLGLVLEILGFAGVIWAACSRRASELAVLSVLSYFLLIGNGRWVFARYVLPLVPFLAVFAAAIVLRLCWRWRERRFYWAAIAGTATLALLEPIYHVSQFDRLLLKEDTRLQAAAWCSKSIPDGSTVGLHGGYYSEPQLPESDEMLQERLRANPGPNRDSYLLQHPRHPRYRLVRVGYFAGGGLPDRWTEMRYDIDALRERGVEYVVTQDSPLRAYARVDPRMQGLLNAHARPIAVFDPFVQGGARAIYDPIDELFVPMAGFSGVLRPGPKITIYRMTPTPGSSG